MLTSRGAAGHDRRRSCRARGLAMATAVALFLSAMPAASYARTNGGSSVARLRIVDLLSSAGDGGGIGVTIDGTFVATGLGFGAASASTTVLAGSHHLQIV